MTSLFKPPSPVLLASGVGSGGGGGGSGSAIVNLSSSVVINGDPYQGLGAVQIATDGSVALSVDFNQRIIIGDPTGIIPANRLTLVDPNGDCLSLINSTTKSWGRVYVAPDNALTFASSNASINFGVNKLYAGIRSFYIGGALVTSSATQLNYTNVSSVGMAMGERALVVDNSCNIAGINSLSAVSLSGALITGNQPNINQLSTVNISNLKLNGTSLTASAYDLNFLTSAAPGTVVASKAVVVDASKNIAGYNTLSADKLVGAIQTSTQANITALGTLIGLSVSGRIGIGTTTPAQALEIKSPSPVIRFNNGSAIAEITMDSHGNYMLNPQNSISISTNSNMLFSGTSSIIGLASLTAASINGIVQTSVQPNITTIGTLSTLATSGDTIIGTLSSISSSYRLTVNEPAGNLMKLSRSATAYYVINVAANGDVSIIPSGNLRIGSRASLIMDGAITGVTDLIANTLTGTLLTPAQPNITSIGTLSSLSVSNTITAGSISAATLAGTITTSNQPSIVSVGTLSSLNVVGNISTSATVNADKLVGTLLTAAQPNITAIGTLSSLTVVNALSAGTLSATTLTGILLTAAQPQITTVGALLALAVAGSTRLNDLTASTIAGTLITAAQPNITLLGTLSSLTVSGNITSASLSASTLTGTLTTATQPAITTIGTLTGLNVSGSIVAAGSIQSSTISGTITTAAQPNITSLGTLTRLLSAGPIGIGTNTHTSALDIDLTNLIQKTAIRITDGTVSATLSLNANGLLIGGSTLTLASGVGLQFMGGLISGLASLRVNELYGLMMTAAQPNITSLGVLASLQTNSIGVGTAPDAYYKANISSSSGKMIRFSNETSELDVRVIDGIYTINTNESGIALGPSVDLILNGGTIIGLDILAANTVNATNIGGTLQTPYQPNITRLGDLTSLNVSGGITANAATIATAHITGGLTVDGPLTLTTPLSFDNLHSSTGYFDAGIPPVSATSGGTLTVIGGAAFSGDVIIGNSLKIGDTTITATTLSPLLNVTPGSVVVGHLLQADDSKNLSGFGILTAASFVGTIATAAQPSITSVGDLLGLNVSGYVGVGTKTPMKQVEINSTTGDCLRLSYNKPTVSSSYLDISVGETGNASLTASGGIISFDSSLRLKQVSIGNTTNSLMPLELGSTPYTMTSSYSFKYASNAIGVINPATAGYISYNYSIRACGRILCTQSIDVTSDRRVKKNITDLTDEWCSKFIESTTPVAFNWKDGEDNTSFGYIAQDLLQHGFHELVNLIPDDDIEEHVDDAGFISPEGIKFTISYEHIIPILAKNQKRLMRENEELKAKLDRILEMLQDRS